jgi:hypothetical protein
MPTSNERRTRRLIISYYICMYAVVYPRLLTRVSEDVLAHPVVKGRSLAIHLCLSLNYSRCQREQEHSATYICGVFRYAKFHDWAYRKSPTNLESIRGCRELYISAVIDFNAQSDALCNNKVKV